jgi:hypothetical protein
MTEDLLRMYNEAVARIHDADILASSPEVKSDSGSVLRVLGFEVLLKCAIKLSGQKPKNSHKYSDLWKALPGYASKEILAYALRRSPGHTDFSDLDKILNAFTNVFEHARYGYEFNEGIDFEEQAKKGEEWMRKGFPLDEAEIAYYPEELFCLIEGLKSYLAPEISNKTL